MGEVGAFISSILPSLICGAIMFYWQRAQQKRDAAAEKAAAEQAEKLERRGEQRRKESLLQLRMQQTNGALSRAIAVALESGKINGNVEAAVNEYDAACAAYENFLAEIGIEHITRI